MPQVRTRLLNRIQRYRSFLALEIRGRRKKTWFEKKNFASLIQSVCSIGFSDAEIADEFGVTAYTIRKWRLAKYMPPQPAVLDSIFAGFERIITQKSAQKPMHGIPSRFIPASMQ